MSNAIVSKTAAALLFLRWLKGESPWSKVPRNPFQHQFANTECATQSHRTHRLCSCHTCLSGIRCVLFLTPQHLSLSFSVQGHATVLLSAELLSASPAKKPFHNLSLAAPFIFASCCCTHCWLAEAVKATSVT